MSIENSTFGQIHDRLGDLIQKHAGGNVSLFARETGINDKTLHTYLKGRLPGAEALFSICRKYSVNVNWLLTGEGPVHFYPSESQEGLSSDAFSFIPLVEAQLSGGKGSFVVSDEVKEYCAFRTEWVFNSLGSPKGKYLLSVAGDSMSPTIQNGDTVMIDTTATHIFDGNIYALRMDDTILIKRLALRPGEKILVISDNREEYEPYEAPRKDIHVLGRVVWFARTLVKSDS